MYHDHAPRYVYQISQHVFWEALNGLVSSYHHNGYCYLYNFVVCVFICAYRLYYTRAAALYQQISVRVQC